jgi:hypothetical protein
MDLDPVAAAIVPSKKSDQVGTGSYSWISDRSIPVVPRSCDSMNIERKRAFQIISFALYDVRE